MAPPDADGYEVQRRCIEELRAEVKTLCYKIETERQEKDMADARHQADMEDQRRKVEEEYESRKAAEAECARAERAAQQACGGADELREKLAHATASLDRRAAQAEEEARSVREQLDELAAAKDEAGRRAERATSDLQIQLAAVQRTIHELEQERVDREALLHQTQADAAAKDQRLGDLEADNLRLKAQAGDADTMAVIRRELTDQVSHIRALETTNRNQQAELKAIRQKARRADVAEEETRALQRRLDGLLRVQDDLNETRFQRQRLEDERLAWAAYLREAGADVEGLAGPQEVVRELTEERLRRAQTVEQMGALRADLAAAASMMSALEQEKAALRNELESVGAAAAAATGDNKTLARLERQRALACKEVEYLRLQLSSFDTEDSTFQPEQFDAQRVQRIRELEGLIDDYKTEVHSLHAQLSSVEASLPSSPVAAADAAAATPVAAAAAAVAVAATGNKRARTTDPEDADEAARSDAVRKLQDEISDLRTQLAMSRKELSVSQSQLSVLRDKSKTRILSLRSNPTSDYEAVKTATLTALRKENDDLLAQLRALPAASAKGNGGGGSGSNNKPSFPLIPASTLDAARRSVAAAQAETASAQKSSRRLKEVWSAKSAEFREAIASTLGWNVSFMPNGKMRVESVYLPSVTEDEHEHSIVFDGERGTMKIGGGPRSPFAARIAEQIGFWVRERGCVPGLLAALTLEFYEESMREEA